MKSNLNMNNTQETKPQNFKPAKPGETHEIVRDKKGRFVPGVSGNPEGPGSGYTQYRTDFRRAIKKIAQANKITLEETMDILHRAGYDQARSGNFQYYKEITDRLYGRQTPDPGEVPQPQLHLHLHEHKKFVKIVNEAEDKLRSELEQEINVEHLDKIQEDSGEDTDSAGEAEGQI